MPKEQPFLWYAGEGQQPEDYRLGPYDTREQAITDAREYYAGQTFTIIEARKGEFSPPSADDLMGEWIERWANDDMWRDDYPEFAGPLEAIKAAEVDLDALLAGWFERHRAVMPSPWSFADSRNAETFQADGEEV